jgi:isopenicillin-N epimerase
LEADFYSGNCHKWLCAPKGAGFLYASPEHHALVEPLVISHGWTDDSTFVSRNQWQGTRDIASFLSVPAAIEFQEANDWNQVRATCHLLASDTLRRIVNLTGLQPLSANSPDWFAQMVAAPIPDCDVDALKRRLYAEYCIEVPVFAWNGLKIVRVSVQGYNTPEDANYLIQTLEKILPLT